MNTKGKLIFGGIAAVLAIVIIMKVVSFIFSKILIIGFLLVGGFMAYRYFSSNFSNRKE